MPVEVYAKFCHKRVEKITRSGAKKGLVKPTLEEIQQAKVRQLLMGLSLISMYMYCTTVLILFMLIILYRVLPSIRVCLGHY